MITHLLWIQYCSPLQYVYVRQSIFPLMSRYYCRKNVMHLGCMETDFFCHCWVDVHCAKDGDPQMPPMFGTSNVLYKHAKVKKKQHFSNLFIINIEILSFSVFKADTSGSCTSALCLLWTVQVECILHKAVIRSLFVLCYVNLYSN